MSIRISDIPQADNLNDVANVINAISSGAETYQDIASIIRKTDRQGRYYRLAAELLGFIKNHRNKSVLTLKGKEFLRKRNDQDALLRTAILNCKIIQRMIPFFELNTNGITREQIIDFLKEITRSKSKTMMPRRASTIISWLKEVNIVTDINGNYFLDQNVGKNIKLLSFSDVTEPIIPNGYSLKEYEDLIFELVVKSIEDPNQKFQIKGRLITASDISEQLKDLGLNWDLKVSSGKTKNYKADFIDTLTRDKLIECVSLFRDSSYFLVNFTLNSTCKVTTKKNLPQPSKKKAENDDVGKRIQFSTGYMGNTKRNLELIIDSTLPDFKKNIPDEWKNIIVYNNYMIHDIELPKNITNSQLLRILAIRKGKIIRSIEVDGETYENQFSFLA